MYELKVKNHSGEVLNLSTSPKYQVYKIEGLQPPKSAINKSNNATTDGDSVNSVRVESRNIVIYISIKGDIEANRINLYKYFPLKQPITIYFKNGARDVYIEGLVELIECDLFANGQKAQISIICAQPHFKAVETLTSHFSDVSALFSFPFSVAADGVELSAITSNVRKSIINTGDIESGLIIELYATGEVVNPVIYDVFKRTHIKLRLTMLANDKIIINTNSGQKSITLVRGGVSSNALGYMLLDSTWLTLGAGDNVFTYAADSGNSNLQLTFSTVALYGGV